MVWMLDRHRQVAGLFGVTVRDRLDRSAPELTTRYDRNATSPAAFAVKVVDATPISAMKQGV